MIIGLFVNHDKDPKLKLAGGLRELLEEQGFAVRVYDARRPSVVDTAFCDNLDVVAVLGGDGTILNATRQVAGCGVPVLGVNIGKLGFLTEIDYRDFESIIGKLKAGEFMIEKRLMLQGVADGGAPHIAVNDLSILTRRVGKMCNLKVSVNGRYVGEYNGDGVVIASPTGSTGYSLSAGGPIVSPETECMLLTPISAHSLTAKPLVLNASDVIEIVPDRQTPVLVSLDGQEQYDVDERMQVVSCAFKANFIRFKTYDFYAVLAQKLNHTVATYSKKEDKHEDE